MKQARFAPSGASSEYVTARENLWKAEKELREHVERVAAQRRTLRKPYLLMYHVMYWQDDKEFCPMCSMWIDGIDGVAHHVARRQDFRPGISSICCRAGGATPR